MLDGCFECECCWAIEQDRRALGKCPPRALRRPAKRQPGPIIIFGLYSTPWSRSPSGLWRRLSPQAFPPRFFWNSPLQPRRRSLTAMNISLSVPSTVASISFSFLTTEDIRRISVKQIVNPVLLDELNRPNVGGLYDSALGPSDKKDM